MNLRRCLPAALALALTVSPALAQGHWVASWGAASVTKAPTPKDNLPPDGLTYRNITRMSLGGSQVRLTLSNLKGIDPLTIDHVTVARRASDDSIKANSLQTVLFSGSRTVTISPGKIRLSDPVSISFQPQADLAVSVHMPQQKITYYTDHPLSHAANYVANGDQVSATSLTNPTNFQPWHFLSAIDVQAPATDSAIVAFGDSITDGAGDDDPPGSNHRWPNYFATRLYKNSNYRNLAVVNEGIGSDRVLNDGGTPDGRAGKTSSGLSRWDFDALARSGVKYIIVLEGVNDIGASDMPRGPAITADDLINAYKTLIADAHAAHVKVIMATMTPFKGAHYWKPQGQVIHDKVNAWIRAGKGFDGVIDFEQAVWDPSDHEQYAPGLTGKDHLHPNAAGRQAMVNAIPLSLFH